MPDKRGRRWSDNAHNQPDRDNGNDNAHISVEVLAGSIDAINRSLKAVTLRNLFVIFILLLLGVPTYVSYWLMKFENRTILWGLFGSSRIVQVMGDCPTVRTTGIDGKTTYVTYLLYKRMPETYIVATIQPELITDVTVSAKVCQRLIADRNKIINSSTP